MLTREHAVVEYDFAGGCVVPDRLTTRAHRQYLAHAARMIEIYRAGVGLTRRELHRAVQGVFANEPACPQRRIDAFCKLLDDASQYHKSDRGEAARLRKDVFTRAAALHPLVGRADGMFNHTEADVKSDVAKSLGRTWIEIRGDLYADVIEFHRLESFAGCEDGRDLLSRYNVGQVQVALYDALSMTVWSGAEFKTILRYAKLARLMHTVDRDGDERYRFRFDGPASILRRTRRYGAALARFLPALVACKDWRMHAVIERNRGKRLRLELTSGDGLVSHLPPPTEFDSAVEEKFAAKWGSEPREGWTLVREGDVLCSGQKAFIPDFTFCHKDGRRVLLEIVGFWTPEYLAKKVQTLRMFPEAHILLAIAEDVRSDLPKLPQGSVVYKTALKVNDVLELLKG